MVCENQKQSSRGALQKKGVFRNFAKFTGKQLSQNLFFNKVTGLKPATSLKKRLWHRCFLAASEIIEVPKKVYLLTIYLAKGVHFFSFFHFY